MKKKETGFISILDEDYSRNAFLHLYVIECRCLDLEKCSWSLRGNKYMTLWLWPCSGEPIIMVQCNFVDQLNIVCFNDIIYKQWHLNFSYRARVMVMVFNTTFNKISYMIFLSFISIDDKYGHIATMESVSLVSLFYVLCYCSYLDKNLHGTKYDYQREKIMNVCFAWLSIHIREISYKKFCPEIASAYFMNILYRK
jgi:hypothetical protein